MEGEKKSAGALTIQTWCSLAETSDEYSALSLRTPTNGECSMGTISYKTCSFFVALEVAA